MKLKVSTAFGARRPPGRWLACGLLLAVFTMVPGLATAQRGVGEIHLRVTDESGAALMATGTLESAATQIRRAFATDEAGVAVLTALPPGIYQLTIARAGFAAYSEAVDVRFSIPIERVVMLQVAPIQATVNVSATDWPTLLNPGRTGSVRYLGAQQLQERASAGPGRSIIDLIATQPGWLLEANGVLHARGSEYQVQYVVDGIPLRDNRSPAFAQSLGVDEFESITIRTGGYPAEFGGKLGGVIEINTARDTRQGLHGAAALQAGSFSTVSGYASAQYAAGKTRAGISAEGMRTDRYLDPPVEANFTNTGRGGGVAGRVERAWSDSARTRAYGYRRRTEFQVPNELLQQEAGQRQDRTAGERLGQVAHEQVLSPNLLMNAGVMVRDTAATLASNARSIPIRATQDRGFTETYVNGSLTAHRGAHELKVGGEATAGSIHERFDSTITARRLGDVRFFDNDLPTAFAFTGRRANREHALYAQDLVRVGPATVSAGLRYDGYRLMTGEHALSPRVSGSWLIDRASLVLHAAYDRTFEPQPIENIILASSDLVERLGGEGASRPLRPSRGHFFEAGASATLDRRARVDVNYYTRHAQDVTDDELLLNTAISFPIAFSSAVVRGIETTLDVPRWGPLSASIAHTWSHGVGSLPLAGGLFLGDDVEELLSSHAEFELSQDQRHTIRGRIRTDAGSRAWLAGIVRYDSGLPVELEREVDETALARQYGASVVHRVDFERGRVNASFDVDLSVGVRLAGTTVRGLRLQGDVFNLMNRLNVINFAGLLSGTAIAPRRSFAVRLQTEF